MPIHGLGWLRLLNPSPSSVGQLQLAPAIERLELALRSGNLAAPRCSIPRYRRVSLDTHKPLVAVVLTINNLPFPRHRLTNPQEVSFVQSQPKRRIRFSRGQTG